MKIADISQKHIVIEILIQSFIDNKSVNYILQNGSESRLAYLMSYSFDLCHRFGRVYLSNDEKACALILFPDQKRFGFWSLYQDIMLIFFSIGLFNLKNALRREALIGKKQYKGSIYYIWFIGVLPEFQKGGIGSSLLQDLLTEATSLKRVVCLETSTLQNIPWYQKFSFQIYEELELSYKLYFLKNELNQ